MMKQKDDQLHELLVKVRLSYDLFLDFNKLWSQNGIQIIPPYISPTTTVVRENTSWHEICSWVFIAMYEASKKCLKKNISGRGGDGFSLFRNSSNDGSFTTNMMDQLVVVMGEEEYGFQISLNENVWKIDTKFMGDTVKRFLRNEPQRYPKLVPCKGFELNLNAQSFALKLCSMKYYDDEGSEEESSIASTKIKILKSIETSNNLLVHFCAGNHEISFNQDIMRMIGSELKELMCSPKNFMTKLQMNMWEKGLLKSENFF